MKCTVLNNPLSVSLSFGMTGSAMNDNVIKGAWSSEILKKNLIILKIMVSLEWHF
jgi:hypothetical protein